MRGSQVAATFFPVIETKQRGSLIQDENGQIVKLKSAKSIPLGVEQTNLPGPFKHRQNTISMTSIGGAGDLTKRKNPNSNAQQSSQKELFKQLSEKLDDHQSQIDARNATIEELERYMTGVKAELINERIALNAKIEQNAKLQENNDKLTTRLRQSTSKYDEMYSKYSGLDSELKSQKENDRIRQEQWASKETGFCKKISELEERLNNAQNEQKQKRKNEQSKETSGLQTQISKLESEIEKLKKLLVENEDKMKKLEKDKLDYCSEALDLRQRCSHYKERIDNLTKDQSALLQKQDASSKEEMNSLKGMLAVKTEQLEKSEAAARDVARVSRELEKKFQQMQDQLNKIAGDNERLKRSEKDKLEEINTLKEYVSKKDGQLATLTQDKMSNVAAQKNEVENLKESVNSLKETVQGFKQKSGQLKSNIEKLEKGEVISVAFIFVTISDWLFIYLSIQQELLKSLKCNHCQKFIKEPITIIPCGHSFCFNCKKAYAKECIKCGPKVKIEAMYRNELLDDIINMYKTLNTVKESMQSMIQSLS